MRILFANLPWWESGPNNTLRQGIRAGSRWPFTRGAFHHPDSFKFGGYLPFPFFLSSAAAYALHHLLGADVELRDSIARGESYTSFLTHLDRTRPDWIVVESATPSWGHDSRVLAVIKAKVPHAQIIVAGTLVAGHDFTLPETCVAAVRGEYEKNVVAVIRDGARGIVDFSLLTDAELNSLPFPMFDEECAEHYCDPCPKGQQFPHLQVFTSRGCWAKCVWCAWPATMTGADPDGTKARRVRGHSPQWVEAMLIDRLARAERAGMPFRSIYLDDDTFNLSDRHALGISEVMGRIGLPWSAMCRADTVKQETWRAMKNAGCFGVKLGIESGSQRVLDEIINKRLNLAVALETARWLRKEVGMTVHLTFTVGMPGETAEERKMTTDLIHACYVTGACDSHQLSGTATIEGTPMAAIARGEHLAKYPGAVGEFAVTGDGQAKIEEMRK